MRPYHSLCFAWKAEWWSREWCLPGACACHHCQRLSQVLTSTMCHSYLLLAASGLLLIMVPANFMVVWLQYSLEHSEILIPWLHYYWLYLSGFHFFLELILAVSCVPSIFSNWLACPCYSILVAVTSKYVLTMDELSKNMSKQLEGSMVTSGSNKRYVSIRKLLEPSKNTTMHYPCKLIVSW
jgi:hypothetical protein